MYNVYVITNDRGRIYIGYTKDLSARLARHNGLLPTKKKSFTYKQKVGIWSLVLTEEYTSSTDAIKREKELKSYQGRQYIRRVIEESNMGR